MREDERRGTGRRAGQYATCRLINPVLLRENGGTKSWRDHRMEKVEHRQGIREEEKSIGGRAGQHATGWSLLCSSLSLFFFVL